MHEVSLAEAVLRIVETSAAEQGFSRVDQMTIEIGEISGVEQVALEFALIHMAPGTLIENTTLVFENTEGSGYCQNCQCRVRIDWPASPCPDCGEGSLLDIEGTELRVRELKVI